MRKGSIKSSVVNSEVLRALAEIIRSEIKDPRVPDLLRLLLSMLHPTLRTVKHIYQCLEMMQRQPMHLRD